MRVRWRRSASERKVAVNLGWRTSGDGAVKRLLRRWRTAIGRKSRSVGGIDECSR